MKFSEALKNYLDQRDTLKITRSATELSIGKDMLEYYAEELDALVPEIKDLPVPPITSAPGFDGRKS